MQHLKQPRRQQFSNDSPNLSKNWTREKPPTPELYTFYPTFNPSTTTTPRLPLIPQISRDLEPRSFPPTHRTDYSHLTRPKPPSRRPSRNSTFPNKNLTFILPFLNLRTTYRTFSPKNANFPTNIPIPFIPIFLPNFPKNNKPTPDTTH